MILSEEPGGCTAFLQWCLPQLRMRYEGFRKVRKHVCKRLHARLQELALGDLDDYRAFLGRHQNEWPVLDSMCRIPITRFYRDQAVFEALSRTILPSLAREALARSNPAVRIWSIGCAAGEEPYTFSILWQKCCQEGAAKLQIVATDSDAVQIARAHRARYPASALRELPEDLKRSAFIETADRREPYLLRDELKTGVEFLEQDVRLADAPGEFNLISCRNLIFTYFDDFLQKALAERILNKLIPGGYLVLGSHESLPESIGGVHQEDRSVNVYRKIGPPKL